MAQPQQMSSAPRSAGQHLPTPITVDARTDRGGLTVNRDAVHVVLQRSGRLAPLGTLVLVADGLGGPTSAIRASRIVSTAVEAAYYRDGQADPASALSNALLAAHSELESAASDGRLMACCTAIALAQGRAYVAHVGDGRALLVRGGRSFALTRAHRVASASPLGGSEEELATAELERLERVLGGRRSPRVDGVAPISLLPGDRIVVCTDGLWDVADDETIAGLAGRADGVEQLTGTALSRRRAAGLPDNVSVAIASWQVGAVRGRGAWKLALAVLAAGVVAGGCVLAAGAFSSDAAGEPQPEISAGRSSRSEPSVPLSDDPVDAAVGPVAVEDPAEQPPDPQPGPEGPELKIGDVHAATAYLADERHRLCPALLERVASALHLDAFDLTPESIEQLIRRVGEHQYKLALRKDGIPGAETLADLGLSAEWPVLCP